MTLHQQARVMQRLVIDDDGSFTITLHHTFSFVHLTQAWYRRHGQQMLNAAEKGFEEGERQTCRLEVPWALLLANLDKEGTA